MQQQAQYKANPIDDLIYDPAASIADMTEYILSAREMMAAGLGLHFPIPEIEAEFPIPPTLPGKVVTIGAQSHNGKSLFLDFWKDDAAKRIIQSGRKDDIIVSVLAEDMVEEAMAVALMKELERTGDKGQIQSEDGLVTVSTRLYGVPIYFIGYSLSRPNSTVDASMTNVERAVGRIVERRKDQNKNTVIQGLFLDYIQAMPLDKEIMSAVIDKRRNLQVAADMQALRRIARRMKCPVVAASQAKEELKHTPGPNMLIPGLLDMGETKVIGDHTDSNFGIWMPKTTHTWGDVVEHGKTNPLRFRVLTELMWIRCNKQRGFDPVTLQRLPANKMWPLKVDFSSGSLSLWTAQATVDTMYETQAQKAMKQ